MHILLSEAMYILGMTDEDLEQIVPDPFGNEPFEGDDEIPDDHPSWPIYQQHMECVRVWERRLRALMQIDYDQFKMDCWNYGYRASKHGSRVMSWFLTEIKDPAQEYVR